VKACRALEESGGTSVLVSDEEILEAGATLGRTEGVFAEPAGGALVAGVQRAPERRINEDDETVCVVITGNGLKDAESAVAATDDSSWIAADIAAVRDLSD
jgi:threonine synthase